MITTICNHKGGSCKTTTLQSIAILHAQNKKRVLLIDLDPQKNLSLLFDRLNTEFDIYDLLLNKTTINDVIYESNFKMIDIISGSKLIDTIKINDFTILNQMLKPIIQNYDYVLIDTPPHLNDITKLALITSDNLLIPLGASVFDIQGLIDINNYIESIIKPQNPKINIIGLLLTRYTPRFIINRKVENDVNQIAKVLNTRVFKQTIRESSQVRASQYNKSSLLIDKPNSNISNDYKLFYKELLKWI